MSTTQQLSNKRRERAEKVENAVASVLVEQAGFSRVKVTPWGKTWDLEMYHPNFFAYGEVKERNDSLLPIITEEGFYAECDKVDAIFEKVQSHGSTDQVTKAFFICLISGKLHSFKIAHGKKDLRRWKRRWRRMTDCAGEEVFKWVYIIPMSQQAKEIPPLTITQAQIEEAAS